MQLLYTIDVVTGDDLFILHGNEINLICRILICSKITVPIVQKIYYNIYFYNTILVSLESLYVCMNNMLAFNKLLVDCHEPSFVLCHKV